MRSYKLILSLAIPVIAIIIAAVLMFALMIMGCVSTRPPADNHTIGKQPAPLKVAIFIWGNDTETAKKIKEELYRRLSYFREITPVELEKRIKIESAYGENQSELSPATMSEIGEKFQVDAIFVGNFMLHMRSPVPSTKKEYPGNVWDFSISIKLVRTTDFKTLWSTDSSNRVPAYFSDLPPIFSSYGIILNPVYFSLQKKWR